MAAVAAAAAILVAGCGGGYSSGNPPADTPASDSSQTPVLHIVSPAAGVSLARGEGLPGAGSFNGTGFSINLEMITRDGVGISAREGTNVRDPSLLGRSNPNLPTLEVTFDADLIKPDGTIIAAGTNLAPLVNIAGSDDTPGAGVTLWTGWHVLESFRDETKSVTIKASITDQSGRVATDVMNFRLLDGHVSGQGLTPKDPRVPGDGVDDADGPEVTRDYTFNPRSALRRLAEGTGGL
jgi:hypothetical protein